MSDIDRTFWDVMQAGGIKNTLAIPDVTISRTPNSNLDKDAFLRLLVTQLQYQDPLNPVDDKEFLAQMAQFSALEQMQNMNTTTSKSQAFSMIGKEIYAEIYNEATFAMEEIEGVVSAVTMKNGQPYLLIIDGNGQIKQVALDDVVEVYDDMFDTNRALVEQLGGIIDSLAVSQNMALVGKHIQAIAQDVDGNPIYVEGKVDSVKFSNGQVVLVVGDKEIFGKEVISVADGMQLIGTPVTVLRLDEATGEYNVFASGPIGNIVFAGQDKKDPYAVIGNNQVQLATANEIVYLTEAAKYVGQELKSGTVQGLVTGVYIKDMKVHLAVSVDGETHYVQFTQARGRL